MKISRRSFLASCSAIALSTSTRADALTGFRAMMMTRTEHDQSLTWVTSAGSLGTWNEGATVSTSVTAMDPDGTAVSYAVVGGTLPAGLALNGSTGAITGTAGAVAATSTSNFTIRATDVNGGGIDRAFAITVTDVATPLSITYGGRATDETDRTTYTFAGLPVGSPATSRVVVVCVTASTGAANRTTAALSVGGVAATKLVEDIFTGGTSYSLCAIYSAVVPVGSSADVVVTFSNGSVYRAFVSTYYFYGPSNAAYATAIDRSNPVSVNLSVPSGGVVIGVANNLNNAVTINWTGLTGNYTGPCGTTATTSVASGNFATGQTVTVTANVPSGSNVTYNGVFASFAP